MTLFINNSGSIWTLLILHCIHDGSKQSLGSRHLQHLHEYPLLLTHQSQGGENQ